MKNQTGPAEGRHRSVADLTREMLSDDPGFVAEFEDRLADREVVKSLAVLRARAGRSQKELAAVLGCTQSKISKIEGGSDADLRFGDLVAYLNATGHEARILFVPAGGTLVDEVKDHAFQIKRLLDRMVELAGDDGEIAKGVADFIGEAAYNLIRFAQTAAAALPPLPPEPPRSIRVEAPNAGTAAEGIDHPAGSRRPRERRGNGMNRPAPSGC